MCFCARVQISALPQKVSGWRVLSVMVAAKRTADIAPDSNLIWLERSLKCSLSRPSYHIHSDLNLSEPQL